MSTPFFNGVEVQVLFAGFRTILLGNNLYSLPIFGVNLPASAISCDIILTILLHILIFWIFVLHASHNSNLLKCSFSKILGIVLLLENVKHKVLK